MLCLAKMPFDDSDLMHLRLLQSVYLSFVGGPGPVGRSAPCASQKDILHPRERFCITEGGSALKSTTHAP